MKSKLPGYLKIVLNIYLVLCTLFLGAGLFYLYQRIESIDKTPLKFLSIESEKDVPATKIVSTVNQTGLSCGDICKTEIQNIIGQAMATVSAKSAVAEVLPILPKATTKPNSQIAFIPLAGPITTTSTGWVDAPGTDVYIDLANEYGKGARAWWDAFLSVANNNGQAYARLYDVTHNISVNGSEVSVTNTSASTQVGSGELSLWAGRNLYRVQVKSLNSFVVTFGNGRIKISY